MRVSAAVVPCFGMWRPGHLKSVKKDALAKLTAIKANVWVASLLADGRCPPGAGHSYVERNSGCPVNWTQITDGGQRDGEPTGPPRPG